MAVNDDEKLFVRAISRVICDKFEVSDEVILKRIKSEKIWRELNF
jgi:hypothetical protein